ncbi:alpha/beta fold hydrolase [Salinispirillum sp. LH 10-3-1]|uniref:Alpha/beta fold hydrolase n=1 Tax=Salinispirillum sp. LH 10-3-1 TaxID=2952525 RepID=A0AB38YD20_9GAMM
MPVLASDFRSSWWLPGGHTQTIIPSVFRRLSLVSQPVEIPLPDDDRLVADYYPTHNAPVDTPLVVIAHGLEGSSQQAYVLGLAAAALAAGYAVLAWNFRGCGRADNLTHKVYYAGCSEDLDAVIHWGAARGHTRLYLSGYSMGANVTLKWLGEQGADARHRGVAAAAVASAPVDLEGCADALERPSNVIYRRRFVKDLSARLRNKARQYPEHFDLSKLHTVRSVRDFDEAYTGPLQGFRGAQDYYDACSAQRFMWDIQVPTLVLNALNDPFLSPSCFPLAQAETHPQVHFEAPRSGGHVGFRGCPGRWHLDYRFLAFFDTVN